MIEISNFFGIFSSGCKLTRTSLFRKVVCDSYHVAGAADDGWEDGARRIIPCESSLAHSGTIVHNEGSNFAVAHFCGVLSEVKPKVILQQIDLFLCDE
jgi:hypothetical protein